MAKVKVQTAAGNNRVIDIPTQADVQNAITAALAAYVPPTTVRSTTTVSAPLTASPTAEIGLTVIDGTALAAMRSDAAPALNQGISPTWTGTHAFSNMITVTGQDVVLVTRDVNTDGTTLTGGGNLSADRTLSIVSTYAGQTSITTLGTIATGVWDGTTIAIAHGGTGQTSAAAAFNALSPLTAAGDLLYGGVSGAGTRLAIGSANYFLNVNAGATAPEWVSPTTALNEMLPAQSTANEGQFLMSNLGAAEWAAVTGFISSGVLTTAGDLLYYDAGYQRLPIGTAGQVLTTVGGEPAWAAPGAGSVDVFYTSFAGGA